MKTFQVSNIVGSLRHGHGDEDELFDTSASLNGNVNKNWIRRKILNEKSPKFYIGVIMALIFLLSFLILLNYLIFPRSVQTTEGQNRTRPISTMRKEGEEV